MKLTPLLLSLSFAANVAMLGAFFFVPKVPSTVSDAPANSAGEPAASRPSPVNTPSATPDKNLAPTAGKTWARLGTEDLASLVARLRADGFPPSVLRAIVNQRFELRREELTLDGLDHPYWKSEAAFPRDPKIDAELAKLNRERTEIVKQLFGPADAAEGDEAAVWNARRYGNLPADKVEKVAALQQTSGAAISQLFAGSNGRILPEDQKKIVELQAQLNAEIAKVLSPDELQEYQMRISDTAGRLRNTLTGFNATEAEYRSLFPLYQNLDAQFPLSNGIVSPEQMAARNAAEAQMQEQIKALLPPDRYADYQLAAKPGMQQLNSLLVRLDLPLSTGNQLNAVQQDIQQRAAAVRTKPDLSAADRTAQLTVLADEANQKVTAAIGARGLEGYKQLGGQWITNLVPRPRPAGKAPKG